MPWKKIGKVAGAVVLGGGVGATAGDYSFTLSIGPETREVIMGVITALTTVVALFVRSPKDDKE